MHHQRCLQKIRKQWEGTSAPQKWFLIGNNHIWPLGHIYCMKKLKSARRIEHTSAELDKCTQSQQLALYLLWSWNENVCRTLWGEGHKKRFLFHWCPSCIRTKVIKTISECIVLFNSVSADRAPCSMVTINIHDLLVACYTHVLLVIDWDA